MKINFSRGLVIISTSIFLQFTPMSSHAESGCCSDHGGVAGCHSTGYQKCKDGTVSPTCKCQSAAKSQTGCCSGHGGVKSCNKSTGFVKCKDGTESPTCTCPKKSKK